MTKNVLITGIAGSGGSYLAEYIVRNHPEYQVHGFARWHATSTTDNLAAIRGKIVTYEVDLLDIGAVVRALQKIRPVKIFHLAAHANVRASFDTPSTVIHNNIQGTINLLEGVRLTPGTELQCFMMCSSSEVYGIIPLEDAPATEKTQFRPASPYAVSKVAQDVLGFTYHKAYSLPIVTTRMFSYINPRRADLFATSFARQIARIEAGKQTVLRHGNLDSTRTLLDVRDAMRAYWLASEKCLPGEAYNICGNSVATVGAVLRALQERAKVEIHTEADQNLFRPADAAFQVADDSKFRRLTGFSPEYSFEQSLDFLMEHSRKTV